jgi:uncharacterized repeat protein (TIGR04052 family)
MRPLRILAPLALCLLTSCDDHDDGGFVEERVTISFDARVGGEPFVCGKDYAGLGADGATGTPQDFRFFVHDVRLIAEDGAEHPVDIEDDGDYQGGGVALLDFENGTGGCLNGSNSIHTNITGTVRAAPRHGGGYVNEFVGLRFRVGVPEDLNHGDLTTLPSPLNDTTMSWSWNAGHIFFSAWGMFGGDAPYPAGVHVGSIGCTGDAVAGEVVSCTNPNRPEIALDGFDLDANTVVVDWGAVWAQLPLAAPSADCEEHDGETSCGCHSFGPESLCAKMFAPLGLDWTSGADASGQSVFRVQ